jgi:hypothetical protein
VLTISWATSGSVVVVVVEAAVVVVACFGGGVVVAGCVGSAPTAVHAAAAIEKTVAVTNCRNTRGTLGPTRRAG